MKITIANDHTGVKVKEQIKALLAQLGHELIDLGIDIDIPIDYPDLAYIACKAVIEGKAERAIILCSAGICTSIFANKMKGIRAALCYDEIEAQMSREHLDANVLCLPGGMLKEAIVTKIVEKWLETKFEGGRHQRRLKKLAAIEEGLDPRTIL